MAVLAAVNGDAGVRVIEGLAGIAPALAEHIVSYGYGDVYARPGLSPAQRQLLTLGVLTALGGCESQLSVHVGSALTVGVTPAEIVEAVVHSAVYCGFPRALNAIGVVAQVFAERGVHRDGDDERPPGRDDPVLLDPEHHRELFANDAVRVRSISYGPGESSVMHDHDDCVVVWLTDGHLRFDRPDGTSAETRGQAHEVRWVPAGRHRPHNLGDRAFAALAVDLAAASSRRVGSPPVGCGEAP